MWINQNTLLSKTHVKICCISSQEEAAMAIAAGADALGLVGPMPSGPGVITDKLISKIAPTIPSPVASFLLTSETTAAGIIAHHSRTGTNTIQIVDAPEAGTYTALRKALPGIQLVQVIHVLNESEIDLALKIAPEVDALLLDSGNPNLAVKELGGTGRVHNWSISREIVRRSPKPVLLAGGLRPDNVRQAIEEVAPYGVDLCSGVRTAGKLDQKKLDSFMEAVKG